MVAFATEYAPTNEAPDAQNHARGFFLAVEVRAGENGLESRHPRREKPDTATKTASGPTNWVHRDQIEEAGGLNLYAFVSNGPASLDDLLGLAEDDGRSRACCYQEDKACRQALEDFVRNREWIWSTAMTLHGAGASVAGSIANEQIRNQLISIAAGLVVERSFALKKAKVPVNLASIALSIADVPNILRDIEHTLNTYQAMFLELHNNVSQDSSLK